MQQEIIDTVCKLNSTTFQKGDVLFKECDIPNDIMYFVFKGEVAIYKLRDGVEKKINQIHPGEFFGEMALIHDRSRLATARIVSDEARLAVINKETLLNMAEHSPEFLFYLLRFSVKRLLAAEDKLQRVKDVCEELKGEEDVT